MMQLCFDFEQTHTVQADASAGSLHASRTRKLSQHEGSAGTQKACLDKKYRGQLAYLAGLAAEDQVVTQYLRAGYVLQEARWRGKSGEIDLILREQAAGGFVFVEVKKSKSFDSALARLHSAQVHRIMKAAEEYLGVCGAGLLCDMRFDVALVDATGQIEILENAFAYL